MRIFAVGERLDSIQPRFHAAGVRCPSRGTGPYLPVPGRPSCGPAENITRRLEDGVLPILHGTLVDDDVRYDVTAFATLERSPLTAGTLRGTHFLVADGHADGHMFTETQRRRREAAAGGDGARRGDGSLAAGRGGEHRGGPALRLVPRAGLAEAGDAAGRRVSLDPQAGFTVLDAAGSTPSPG